MNGRKRHGLKTDLVTKHGGEWWRARLADNALKSASMMDVGRTCVIFDDNPANVSASRNHRADHTKIGRA
jgi:hypothetical protein